MEHIDTSIIKSCFIFENCEYWKLCL